MPSEEALEYIVASPHWIKFCNAYYKIKVADPTSYTFEFEQLEVKGKSIEELFKDTPDKLFIAREVFHSKCNKHLDDLMYDALEAEQENGWK